MVGPRRRSDDPVRRLERWRVLSTSTEELRRRAGSRYAPASPCEKLDEIASAPGPCVFIGKPCDVAATAMARRVRPDLDERLALTIGIFCAGTPSTRATLEMAAAMGVEAEEIAEVRYRGNGWPGEAAVTTTSGERHTMSYERSWGEILQKRRQWRCYVCADHTGEFADVAVGDPWYRPVQPGEPGRSLLVVRTPRGRDVVRAAIAAGSVVLHRVDPGLLAASQPNLLEVRGSLWGRILACRMMGIPAPVLKGLPTFPAWWRHLSLRSKLRSIYGMVKRVFTKRLYRRRPVVPAPEPGSSTDPRVAVERRTGAI